MLLPAMTAAVLRTTGIVQYLRNEVIDAKSQDYVKTARSKGVPIDKVYTHHIFRKLALTDSGFLRLYDNRIACRFNICRNDLYVSGDGNALHRVHYGARLFGHKRTDAVIRCPCLIR